MSIMSRFPDEYLKGPDIEAGEVVTITHVTDERVGEDQELKPVLYIEEYDRGIILNKTNARTLARILGDDETLWPGKKIVVITVPTRNPQTGEDCDAIRMQAVPAAKKKAAATVAAAIDDEIPDFN